MSNECTSLAQKRRIGSAAKKSVLMYLADRASDDGSGIWTSKAHIAVDTELSKRSVQKSITEFEQDGILIKTGTRPCQNGYTYEYRLVLDVLRNLPSTRDDRGEPHSPVNPIHLSGEPGAPQDVNPIHPNHPLTTHEPPNTPIPPEGAGDLFNELPEQSETDQLELLINEAWEEFQEIWPKGHPRRQMGKQGFEKFDAACRGKISKASGAIAPKALNRAARAYMASVREPQFIKGTVAWLNNALWEPFMADAQEFNIEDLNPRQRAMLEDGRVPPSMMEDGQPNAAAKFWLKKFGFGRAA